MRGQRLDVLTAGRSRKRLSDGSDLRLLTAAEVLEARREALEMEGEEAEIALRSNACILAKAWERRGRPIYPSGAAVLEALSVSQIIGLCRLWAEFDRAENPGLSIGEERLEALKKAWSTRLWSAFAGVCSAALGRSQRRSG